MAPGSQPHPAMGKFPGSTPMYYVLLACACLSPNPEERPTASMLIQVPPYTPPTHLACLSL